MYQTVVQTVKIILKILFNSEHSMAISKSKLKLIYRQIFLPLLQKLTAPLLLGKYPSGSYENVCSVHTEFGRGTIEERWLVKKYMAIMVNCILRRV
jgi:ABC-type transporter MlaC component